MRGNPAALAPWNTFKEPYTRGHKFGSPSYWSAVREASAAWHARKGGGMAIRSNPDDGGSYVATEVLGSTAGTLLGLGIFFGAVALVCNQVAKSPQARTVQGNPYQSGCR